MSYTDKVQVTVDPEVKRFVYITMSLGKAEELLNYIDYAASLLGLDTSDGPLTTALREAINNA